MEAAPAGSYKTDPSHSTLQWSFDHFGLSRYTARFTGVEARLEWNPSAPETSRLEVTIDPRSVRTDYPWPESEDFDAKLATGPEFFASQPISFVSKSIQITGERTGKVDGMLTMRGQTQPAILDMTFNGSLAHHPLENTAKLGFSASTTIQRSQWGLDFALPVLGDDVRIDVETQMVPTSFVLGEPHGA
jgi:polyisoprenoid-binding protein YceI